MAGKGRINSAASPPEAKRPNIIRTWSEQKVIACQALVDGVSTRAAAREAECDQRRIFEWMLDPEFAQIVTDGRMKRRQEIVSRAGDVVDLALQVLADELRVPGTHSREVRDLAERISRATAFSLIRSAGGGAQELVAGTDAEESPIDGEAVELPALVSGVPE